MKLQNNSRIQTKQLNNLSDSWELKFIFGLVNSNPYNKYAKVCKYTVSTLNEAHQMLNEQPIEID